MQEYALQNRIQHMSKRCAYKKQSLPGGVLESLKSKAEMSTVPGVSVKGLTTADQDEVRAETQF